MSGFLNVGHEDWGAWGKNGRIGGRWNQGSDILVCWRGVGVCSLVCSLVSFACYLACSLACSLVCSLVCYLVCSLVCSFAGSGGSALAMERIFAVSICLGILHPIHSDGCFFCQHKHCNQTWYSGFALLGGGCWSPEVRQQGKVGWLVEWLGWWVGSGVGARWTSLKASKHC